MEYICRTGVSTDLKKIGALLLPILIDAQNKPIAGIVPGFFSAVDEKCITTSLTKRRLRSGQLITVKLEGQDRSCVLSIEGRWSPRVLVLVSRRFIRMAKQERWPSLSVECRGMAKILRTPITKVAAIIAENVLLAEYDFSEQYKTPPAEGWFAIQDIALVIGRAHLGACKDAVREARIVAESVNRCRTLANYPPSDLKPEGMAEAARDIAREFSEVKVTVFDEQRLRQEGMNAILAVGQGSASPPRLIMLEYSGFPTEKTKKARTTPVQLALIGKGVTFDSGGLNLKPGEHMADMHMDMSGGAAVLYAMRAIAALKLKINVIGLVPAVENMPSGLSYRQGDIIRAYGGKTIEIGNTDAEGRVILADAIEYAKTKKPVLIAEISTLTGAAEVALGQRAAALFVKNNKPLSDVLQQLGEETGDRLWPLPLWDEHERDVEGNLADVTNTHKNGSRWGGAITGAAFLSVFAGEAPFVHIDMAPRMLTLPEEEQLSRGASGFGVRLFVGLARQFDATRRTLTK